MLMANKYHLNSHLKEPSAPYSSKSEHPRSWSLWITACKSGKKVLERKGVFSLSSFSPHLCLL